MIHVVLASNRNYFLGLLTAVTSLVRSNKLNSFRIHIIHDGLPCRQQLLLQKRATQSNPANGVIFHTLDNSMFTGFKVDYGKSYMTYARILVASLIEANRVIYLDTDLLITSDLRPLWEINLEGCIVAAAQDRDIQFVRNDYPLEGPCSDAKYFNAGVMVIDLTLWRLRCVQETLLQMITADPAKFRWWDQTAMNALFQNQVHFLDRSWNTFADSVTFSGENHARILHYVGGTKPWTRYLDTPEFRLWRRFFSSHVLPRLWLFLDHRMISSFLLHMRHRGICRSRAIKSTCVSLLRLKALLSGNDSSESIQQFIESHPLRSPQDEANSPYSDRRMEAFMLTYWG